MKNINNNIIIMNISILEDDVLMAKNLAKKLLKSGYESSIYHSVKKFTSLHNMDSDLYIIDISLGDGDGFKVIKWLRDKKNISTPIIITSSYNDTEKKIYGLDIGADDYLTKPFAPDELIARVRTLLRRSCKENNSSIIKHGNIEFNLRTKEVKLSGKEIHFTKKEKLIIEFFLLKKGELIEKTKLINSIWGSCDTLGISDNTINVTISRVRRKLGKSFKLKTIINGGYILY